MNPFSFRYPGRFIVIGKDGDSYVALYGATGRSPSSLARKFMQDDTGIYMAAIDGTVSKEKNPELFEYPAVKFFRNGLVIANGRQIENISELQNRDARQQLSYALSEEAYEPDEYKTPRITGCLVESEKGMDAALHIVRIAPDGIDRSSWSISFENGRGLYIGTYRGDDVKPTPSFSGNPIEVKLDFGSAKNAAKMLFEVFSPPVGELDYRVGMVVIYKKLGSLPEIAIVNRN
ncbi:MAG: IMP cyclohydrolase [bacterium]|nr:IMP cyclohydrolase [bacterium]